MSGGRYDVRMMGESADHLETAEAGEAKGRPARGDALGDGDVLGGASSPKMSMRGENAADAAGPYDLAIIGAGPAGLYGAMYAGLRQMRVVIIDSLPMAGGQLAAMYPEKWVLDVPGFARARAGDIAEQLARQGLQDGPKWQHGCKVERLRWDTERKVYCLETRCSQGGNVVASNGQQMEIITARGILIAAGVGAIEPRKLACAGAEDWAGRGLAYEMGDVGRWAGKRVAVIGGNAVATAWAGQIAQVAAAVCVIGRSEELKGTDESLARLNDDAKVQIQLRAEVVAMRGGENIEAIVMRLEDGSEKIWQCDAVLGALGMVTDLGPIGRWGLATRGGQITVNQAMETSLVNVWAAGDIADYPGKIKLIATGFSEAACAVNHACHRLNPEKSIFPGHSTNLRR